MNESFKNDPSLPTTQNILAAIQKNVATTQNPLATNYCSNVLAPTRTQPTNNVLVTI